MDNQHWYKRLEVPCVATVLDPEGNPRSRTVGVGDVVRLPHPTRSRRWARADAPEDAPNPPLLSLDEILALPWPQARAYAAAHGMKSRSLSSIRDSYPGE